MRLPARKTAFGVNALFTQGSRHNGTNSLLFVGMVLRAEERLEGFGFGRFGAHDDPRLDRRIPRLYGLLLSIAVLGGSALTVALLMLVRLVTG